MQADLLAPAIAPLDFAAFMREALYEAEQAELAGELPIVQRWSYPSFVHG
jgi:hypothetical protein